MFSSFDNSNFNMCFILVCSATYEIKANRPEPYQNVCKRFAHDQSSWVVTGVKKIQELI